MAIDASGNWYPLLPDPPAATTSIFPETLGGTGVPSNDIGDNGDIYVDGSTGDLYVKSGDTWTLNVPGSGAIEGQSGNYAGGEPTFTPTSSVALAYDTSTDPATEWIWHTGAWH